MRIYRGFIQEVGEPGQGVRFQIYLPYLPDTLKIPELYDYWIQQRSPQA